MNDQLIMENYLLILKSTVEVYIHGTLESSNNDIKNLLKDSLNEIIISQGTTYDNMVKFGWYQIENIDKNKIKENLNKTNSN